MADFSFDPRVGEKVSTLGHNGTYEIIRVYPQGSAPGLGTADLRLQGTEYVVRQIPWSALIYPPESLVRRVLENFQSLNVNVPDDVQPDRFEVLTGETYEGDPKISVNFFLKPSVTPSIDKASTWNRFSSDVDARLHPFVPESYWLDVRVKEDRGALSAAS